MATSSLFPLDALASHRETAKKSAQKGSLEERVSALEGRVDEMQKMLESTMMKRLEEHGHIINRFGRFNLALGATGIMQGSFRNERNSTDGNSLAGSGSFDVTVTSEFSEHFVATAHLEAGVYNGIDNTFTNALLFGPVNGDDLATGKDLSLSDAETFLEAVFFDKRLGFAAGLLDPTVFYDTNTVANDETTQFLNGGFVNNTTVEFPQSYAIGGLAYGDFDIVKISAGVFDGASGGINMENNLFWIGELDFSPTVFDLKHHYRVYGWGNHDNTAGAPKKFNTARMGFGFGASFDQQIFEWLTLFERIGYARKLIYTTELSFSGGLHFAGKPYGREDDSFGLAGGAAITNKSQVPRNEYVIEALYSLGLGKGHVHISPDVQFIINPAGQDNLKNAIFLAMRAQLDF